MLFITVAGSGTGENFLLPMLFNLHQQSSTLFMICRRSFANSKILNSIQIHPHPKKVPTFPTRKLERLETEKNWLREAGYRNINGFSKSSQTISCPVDTVQGKMLPSTL